METIEDILREVREYGDTPPPRGAWIDIANRIEAAHKREVAELRECVREAYTDVCLICTRDGRNVVCSRGHACEHVKRWRKALEGGD